MKQERQHNRYIKYIFWVLLFCTELLLGSFTNAHPVVICISMLGIVASICSAEGLYITHFLFIAYAIGAACIAWNDKLYGDVITMAISAAGSCVALVTWHKNLRRHTVKTRLLSLKGWVISIICLLCGSVMTYMLMLWTDSHLPILNALVLSAVLSAEWLYILRYCESYIIYFIGDLLLAIIWGLNHNWMMLCTCILQAAFEMYGLVTWKQLSQTSD